jgi:hypothetical protein
MATLRVNQIAFCVIAATIGLVGCGRGSAKVLTLKPVQFGLSDVATIHDNTRGGTGGDAALNRQFDEVVAGYERFYNPDPVRNIQHAYRGIARFDLRSISVMKSKVVDKAVLSYKIRQSYIRDLSGASPDFPNVTSCAKELYTITEDWSKSVTSEGYAETLFPVDTKIATLPATAVGGSMFQIDVTKAAQRWVVKPEENFGLVFKGSDETTTGGAKNDACATRLGDLSLNVHVTVYEP